MRGGQHELVAKRCCPLGSCMQAGLFHQAHGEAPPCQEHDRLPQCEALLDQVMRQYLPAQLAVGVGGVLRHGECRVEQQNALLSPPGKVAGFRRLASQVGSHLLIYVAQARRELLALRYGKREPHGLTGLMIGVLPEDDGAHVAGRRVGKRVENVVLSRVDGLRAAHGRDFAHEALAGRVYLLRCAVEPQFDVVQVPQGYFSLSTRSIKSC